MIDWAKRFRYNPLKPLLESKNDAVVYFANRDLLGEQSQHIEDLWKLKIPNQILHKQQPNGSWKYPSKKPWHTTDYDQLETYRQLGFLVQMFGMDRKHPAIEQTAEYFFANQAEMGDFRGIYAKQYSPNYTAAIAELLIRAGYESDSRVKKVFDWLLAIRQDDGGWALPLRTKGHNLEVILSNDTIEPDPSKPFSHLITGIVLRAFAAHPDYAKSKEARKAGELLLSRFFKKDVYVDLNKSSAWETFSYPFWNTDLLSSLDTLSKLGLDDNEPNIGKSIDWLLQRQRADGLLDLHKNHDRYHDQELWLTLVLCKVIKHFYPE